MSVGKNKCLTDDINKLDFVKGVEKLNCTYMYAQGKAPQNVWGVTGGGVGNYDLLGTSYIWMHSKMLAEMRYSSKTIAI